jgi:5-methylcytosine-specific restriction endonuclease McrA
MSKTYSLTHVRDHEMPRGLAAVVGRENSCTAEVLAWIAEFDARKLFLPAAYPNMYEYCLGELKMSEDRACKRIRAARAARDFPAIFELVADGRLSLSAVLLLAPRLKPGNAAELLAAASNKRRAGIELLLAERFPAADVTTLLQPMTVAGASPSAVEPPAPETHDENAHSSAPGRMGSSQPTATPQPEAPPPPRPRVAPLSPGRYELRTTLDQATHDQLRRLQELLSHSVPSGDIAEVLGRAFELAIKALEKRRFAATAKPGARRRSKSARHIPAHVQREVSDRDRYQCTFVSEKGRRCTERRFLEFDHVHPVARGGQATVENTRLRCRAHNQFEAERTYGAGFMREKREVARSRAVADQMSAAAEAERARMRAV